MCATIAEVCLCKLTSLLQAHPERRYKAALAAYKERELPILRKERPGLRLQQYEEIIYKASRPETSEVGH